MLTGLRSYFQPRVKIKAFICGCGHSASSLLANILASHPDIYVPLRETNAFLNLRKAKRNFRRLLREARASGRPAFVEKTPRHIHHVNMIRQLAPGAHFVMPVRDGRDVAASLLVRNGELASGIERWITENQIVASERGKKDVFVYRHEDLVDDPAKWVRSICNFIGVEYKDSLLEYHKQPKFWAGITEIEKTDGVGQENHQKLRTWQVNQPIFDNRGRWRKELSEADVDPFVRGEGAHLMRAFGYL